MRVNRAKAVRKSLQFFNIVFGYEKAKFHVLLDGNFIYAAIKYKIDIQERLDRLLQNGVVKLYVLKSVLEELRQVGVKTKSSLDFAMKYCETLDDSKHRGDNANERIISMMKQQHSDWLAAPSQHKRKFMVATQDKDLRSALGYIPGIPLIYLNKVILVLEPPSPTSREFNQRLEMEKITLKAGEAAVVENVKKRKTIDAKIVGGEDAEAEDGEDDGHDEDKAAPAPARKKHKAFAPNPLSSLRASQDSKKQMKRSKEKFRR
jgi:U3 small nucleolar RNA-associated protein 23